jgi:NAD(P)-dependent dehydrogenase (short-subunit alcohol dehydrogenase family)
MRKLDYQFILNLTMKSKIALITGGSRGLGRKAAIRLAEEGNDIIVTYRTKKDEAVGLVLALQGLGRKAVALPLDTKNIDRLDEFMDILMFTLREHWNASHFDFLVNYASVGTQGVFAETSPQDFDRMMNAHFKWVYFLTQKSLPMLNDHGRIINVSSGTTRITNPDHSLYSSMKGAIEVLTRSLAEDLRSRGITVNVVDPSPNVTQFNDVPGGGTSPQKKPLNVTTRYPVTIGDMIAFLCSADGHRINGQRIDASGDIHR